MKTSPVTTDDLPRSVLAVPPMAWRDDGQLDEEANAALIRHMRAGGVSTFLYGGNANFYNIPAARYGDAVSALAALMGPEDWLIPSVGPDYGKLMDEAPIARESGVPTVMVLPLAFPATPDGAERGIRDFVDAFGRPVIAYVKSESYLTPENIGRLADDGLLCAIKYAIVRADPGEDTFLEALIARVGRALIVSGIGERPAVTHLRDFGLTAFTSGSVCVAPAASTALLAALRQGDFAAAEAVRAHFLALETLRDTLSPIRVLHEAVTLAGIADMGRMLPLLSNIEPAHHAEIEAAARQLLAYDREISENKGRASAGAV